MKIFTFLSGFALAMIGLDQILGPPVRAGRSASRGASSVVDKAADTATSVMPGPARRISRDFLRGLGVLRADRSIAAGEAADADAETPDSPQGSADPGQTAATASTEAASNEAAAPIEAASNEAAAHAEAASSEAASHTEAASNETAASTDEAHAIASDSSAGPEASTETEAKPSGEPASEGADDSASEWLPEELAVGHPDGSRVDDDVAERAVAAATPPPTAYQGTRGGSDSAQPSNGGGQGNGSAAAAPKLRLGHVHLLVSDLERSLAFYTGQVGFEVTEQQETFAFLSGGSGRRDLVLQAAAGAAAAPDGQLGVHHVAFELPDEQALGSAAERLVEAQCGITAIDHGISKAIYTDDPDSNRIELMCDTAELAGTWDGTSRPLDLSALG